MRIRPLYTIILTAGTMLTSCGDFLERSAQDLVIPKNVAQYKELLQGEGYFKEFNSNTYFLNYMTDDMEFISYQADRPFINSSVQKLRGVYCWQQEIETDEFTDGLFAWGYKQVLAANTCLDALGDMEGTTEDKAVLEGQALFQRAYAYFLLVNAYGYTYTGDKADVPCLPLRLDPTPSAKPYKRVDSRTIWNQIESDITRSTDLLKSYTPQNKYEINGNAALLLAARVELYMEKFAEAEQYAANLLDRNGKLYDISGKGVVEPSAVRSEDHIGFLDYNSNPEILWNFCERTDAQAFNQFTPNMMTESEGFRISQPEPYDYKGTLLGSYNKDIDHTSDDKADRRKCFFFNLGLYTHSSYDDSDYAAYGGPEGILSFFGTSMPAYCFDAHILKYDENDSQNTLQQAFRTAEAYLILAEAYARQSSPYATKALESLNTLRRNRISDYTDLTPADFSSNDELVNFIFDERRRELCFEECHRWWDLKRYNRPELTHRYQNNETYILGQDDEAYTLSSPLLERSFDNSIVNRRPVRTAQ